MPFEKTRIDAHTEKILIGSRNLLLFLFVSSLLAVVAYKFIPVYYTPLMFIRVYEQVRDSKPIKLEHKWMPLKQIAQPLAQAVVASEDNLFLDHDGFDMIQIQKARADAEKANVYEERALSRNRLPRTCFSGPEGLICAKASRLISPS